MNAIEQLCADTGLQRDHRMIALCEMALNGDAAAIAAVEEMIAALDAFVASAEGGAI